MLPDLEAIAEGGAVQEVGGNDDDDENMATAGDDTIYDIPTRQTAAAIASRVFFHLEEPRQALRLALDSGDDNFNVLCPSFKDVAYVEKLVNAAIGEYVKRKQREFDGDDNNDEAEEEKKKEEEEEEELDMNKLHNVVQLMFQRCYADKSYGHALGVAFEAREATKVEEILEKLSSSSSSDSSNNTNNSIVETLKYAVISAHTLIPSKSFRFKALELIASSLTKVFEDDNSGSSSSSSSNGATAAAKRNAAFTLALCRQLLGQANAVGGIIVQLIDSSNSSDDDDDMALLGLQLCFDIIDSGDQAFVNAVAECLPKKEQAATANEGEEAKVDVEAEPSPIRSEATWAHFTNAHRILTGGFTSELSLSFLYKNSNSDKLLMSNLKKSLEEQRTMSRNSVLHNCAVTAHGYLNAGTTDDLFLRDNLDWMKKASNW